MKDPKAFIPFAVLGYPDPDTSIEILRAMVEGGADMLELGFPFSDPIADGPILQAANTIAVERGINTDACFEIIQKTRQFTDLPIGLLLYYNLVFQYGIDRFCEKCAALKVNTILIADVSLEESGPLLEACQRHGLQTVFIVSELTDEKRLQDINACASGFLYVVSKIGVTGAKDKIPESTNQLLKRLKQSTSLPLFVGFGISNPGQVSQVCQAGADGAICGSAITRFIKEHLENKELLLSGLRDFVAEMKAATK